MSPRGLSPNQMGDFLPAIEMGEGWTVHSLSAGYYHNCAIVDQVDELSSVVCWGANFKGQVRASCVLHLLIRFWRSKLIVAFLSWFLGANITGCSIFENLFRMFHRLTYQPRAPLAPQHPTDPNLVGVAVATHSWKQL